VTVNADDVTRFVRDLAEVADNEPKAMRKAYSRIASHTQSKARTNASLGGGQYAAAKSAIRGTSDATSAGLRVSRSGRVPFAQGVFWGAKGRFGWYAQSKYADSDGRQFPEWVGDNWEAGKPGEGPYVLNYTVAEELPEIIDRFGDAIDDLFDKPFNH
jgi:hypothetical protein